VYQYLQLLLIVIAVASVAIADVVIKKAAMAKSISEVFFNPWMLLGICLYLVQIILFTWMFVKGWDLSVVGILQTVFYAVIVLFAGFYIYGEKLSFTQIIGLGFAAVAVVLISFSK
jgi:drug/metabolite transporter (DMT)-like permease